MRVLLTGGSGFIGAWVARALLARGHEITIFDVREDRSLVDRVCGASSSRIQWHVGDIASPDQLDQAADGCESVIHLAGVLTPACKANPRKAAIINVIGTINVFEAARRRHWPCVAYASSAGVFGPQDSRIPSPDTLYGVFKQACEGIAHCYWEESDPGQRVASIGLRPLVVYGAGRTGGSSAGPSLACEAAVRRQSYVVPFSGTTGFVYVEDVADAFVRAALSHIDGAHVFNMPGTVASIDEFLVELRKQVPDADVSCAGSALPITPYMDGRPLYALVPEVRQTSLEEGIRSTLLDVRRLEPD